MAAAVGRVLQVDRRMTTRQEQKRKTRRALLDAALRNLGPERGFASLSLREVAREAGIAPTSFYRHFHDLDQLALALVDEAGAALHEALGRARERARVDGDVVRGSVEAFMEYQAQHAALFRLLLRERAGGSEAFRTAIRDAFRHFADELAEAFGRDNEMREIAPDDAGLVAEAMVTLVFDTGAETLDLDAAARAAATERLIRQLRILRAGARAIVPSA